MATKITRERLHSIIDDSIENGADTLIIASKKNGHPQEDDLEWGEAHQQKYKGGMINYIYRMTHL